MQNSSDSESLFYGCFDGLRGLELAMTKEQALSCSHQGDCEADCKALAKVPAIYDQLDAFDPQILALGLAESGAWDDEELSDYQQNKIRVIWLAACDIKEENRF